MPIELDETQRRAEDLAEAVDDLHAAIAQKGMLQGRHADLAHWITLLRADLARVWGDPAYANALQLLAREVQDPALPKPEPRADWKRYLANVCGSLMKDELYGADIPADGIYQVWVDPACPSPATAVRDALLLNVPIRFAEVMHCDVFDPETSCYIEEVEGTPMATLTGMAAVGRKLTPGQENTLFTDTPRFIHELREHVIHRWHDVDRNLFSHDRNAPELQGGPDTRDPVELAKQVEWTAGVIYQRLLRDGFLNAPDQQLHYRILRVRREAAKLAGHPESARDWGQRMEKLAGARLAPSSVWNERLLVVANDASPEHAGVYRAWVSQDCFQPLENARMAFLEQHPFPFASALRIDLIDPVTGESVQPSPLSISTHVAPMAEIAEFLGPEHKLDSILVRKRVRPATISSSAPAP